MENEGGYSENKNDKGGKTKYGISLRFLRGIGIQKAINDLSKQEAENIYKQHFWFSNSCDKIKNEKVAIKLFDMCINFGGKTAIKMFQKVVGVSQDGIIGTKTLQALNDKGEDEVLNGLIQACETRYNEIIKNAPNQKVFLKGWMTRARRIPT